MPHLLLIVSQSDSFIQIVDINSHSEWQTVHIQISWLQKPTDLDLHCLQRQGISGFSRKGLTFSLSGSIQLTTNWRYYRKQASIFRAICIKCQNPFLKENKTNIPKRRLLKFFPALRALNLNEPLQCIGSHLHPLPVKTNSKIP